jgi:hypothetical protein
MTLPRAMSTIESARLRIMGTTWSHCLRRLSSLPALLVTALLGGCALATDDLANVFVDPTKYDLYSCAELAKRREEVSKREQELRGLMDKAEQGTGGVVASALAYRTDYLNARGELRLLQDVSQRKDCVPTAKPAAGKAG